jgi:hypothetical protein
MDFIGGALPNVMFLVGIIAIGIGLGIEFKIVEIKAELNKQGRMATIGFGVVLIGVSIFLYTRPQESSASTAVAPQPLTTSQIDAVRLPDAAPTAGLIATAAPTVEVATVAPAAPTVEVATAAPAAPVAVVADPEAAFRNLVLSAVAEGRIDKSDRDLIKNLEDAKKELDKGKREEAEEKIREIQFKISEGASEGKMDDAFAKEAIALLDQMIVDFGL